ncbi:DUF4328 domain-containing protein [Streptomyces sp. NBC_01236]|uniref:DUF4328 domain-containing protein n=1 Tax=Streptomyces sp. NBC_01236 TaxID=2903789 RepID=UPI002E116265|nr:DUF4328 domain-containing protein [Streptomyces sp. NBC_01236]
MLCTHCRRVEATAGDGLCDVCIVATANPRPGSSSGTPAQLRSPVGLGQATVVMLVVSAAAGLFALYSILPSYDILSAVSDGAYQDTSGEKLDEADRLLNLAGHLQFILEIATAVVFICWFQRVRVNAEVFGPQDHRMRRAWVVWGWFVPVANLWIPRRIAADIWDASAPLPTLSLGDGSRMPSSPHSLLNSWWGLWAAAAVTDRLSSQSMRRADTPDELRSALGLMGVSEVLWITSAVLAVMFVRRLTRMQNEKALRGPAARVAV